MNTPATISKSRRGATLIEAVVVVLVLAIAVPPTISGMMGSANRRADAIQITRATTSLYTNLGMSYTVTIGPKVNSSLVATGVFTTDLYRQVTVTSSFADSAGAIRTIPVTTMISIP